MTAKTSNIIWVCGCGKILKSIEQACCHTNTKGETCICMSQYPTTWEKLQQSQNYKKQRGLTV